MESQFVSPQEDPAEVKRLEDAIGGYNAQLATANALGTNVPQQLVDAAEGFITEKNPAALKALSEQIAEMNKDAPEMQAEQEEAFAADVETLAQKEDAVAVIDRSIAKLDALKVHPGFKTSVGAKGFSYLFGLKDEPISGTDAAGFMARLNEIRGEVFLDAFTQLKGGGSITETEGRKAEQARARIDPSQPEKDFKEGIADYRSVLEGAKQRELESIQRLKSKYPNIMQVVTTPSTTTQEPSIQGANKFFQNYRPR